MKPIEFIGPWPNNFPLQSDDKVEEGLKVWSQDRTIEGRTTGSRQPCTSTECPGWFIGVNWETGQTLFPCSEGWAYDPETSEVRITGGGNISARFISPEPFGVDPLPKQEWPTRESLRTRLGWRVTN